MDFIWVPVLVILLLLGLIMLAWPRLLVFFTRDYYQKHYEPIYLQKEKVADPLSTEAHLQNVPWITSEFQLCQSTSLQMVGSQLGLKFPRANYDFLMASTYGMSNARGYGFMPLGTDPEMGLLVAAPFLGLKRCYYVSNDEKIFTGALRSFLSKGFALRIALDEGTLYDVSEFIAHSEVLVGYNASGFYYYETVGLLPSESVPGERASGEEGIFVSEQRLLDSIRRMSTEMKYPWKYALTLFEPGPLSEDLRPVWDMIGKATGEEIKYGPRMGSKVLEEIGIQVQRQGVNYDVTKIEDGIDLAAKIRKENADFLKANFGYEADIKQAAIYFEEASEHYVAVAEDIADGIRSEVEAKRVASHLFDAAIAERKAGEIFLKRAKVEE